MKKILTCLIAAAMLVVATLSMSGCSLEKEFQGDYKKATHDQLVELQTKLNESSNGSVAPFSSVKDGFKIDAEIEETQIDVSNKLSIEMAISRTNSMLSLSFNSETSAVTNRPDLITSQDIEVNDLGKMEMAMYCANDKVYTYIEKLDKSVEKTTSDVKGSELLESQEIATILSNFDFSPIYNDYLNQAIADDSLLDFVLIAKGNAGTGPKLQIKTTIAPYTETNSKGQKVSQSSQGVIYLSFAEDYSIRGIKVDMKTVETLEVGEEALFEDKTTSKIKMVLIPYDGNISIPKTLDGYAK